MQSDPSYYEQQQHPLNSQRSILIEVSKACCQSFITIATKLLPEQGCHNSKAMQWLLYGSNHRNMHYRYRWIRIGGTDCSPIGDIVLNAGHDVYAYNRNNLKHRTCMYIFHTGVVPNNSQLLNYFIILGDRSGARIAQLVKAWICNLRIAGSSLTTGGVLF